MVRLTENMVRKQREDDGPDLAGFDSLHPRLLEIAELLRKHPCAPRPQNRFFSYLLRQPFAYVEFI